MSDVLLIAGVLLLLTPLLLLAWWVYAPVSGLVLLVAGVAELADRGVR